jgi:hypothetical protein
VFALLVDAPRDELLAIVTSSVLVVLVSCRHAFVGDCFGSRYAMVEEFRVHHAFKVAMCLNWLTFPTSHSDSTSLTIQVRDGNISLGEDGLTLVQALFSAKFSTVASEGGSSMLARKKRQLRLRQKAYVLALSASCL